MRHGIVAALVAGVGVTTLVVAAPAGAMVPTGAGGPAVGVRQASGCEAAVLGVDPDSHVRSYVVRDGQVVHASRTNKKLLFQVTAWGYFDSGKQGRESFIRLNAVTADGQPRRVSISANRHGGIALGGAYKYRQDHFTPTLFADNYTYFSYTVERGRLERWTLTKFADKHVKYVHPVQVRRHMGDLTSLQATAVAKVHGVPSEILYGTTSDGRLLQIVVPLQHPSRARVHTLAPSGYEGVTELSWTVCNPRGKGDSHALVAIDATGDRATWTTVEHAYSKPRASLHGAVTDAVPGPTEWRLSAAI
jgi:hypothetical protein